MCTLGFYISFKVAQYNELLGVLSIFSGMILGVIIINDAYIEVLKYKYYRYGLIVACIVCLIMTNNFAEDAISKEVKSLTIEDMYSAAKANQATKEAQKECRYDGCDSASVEGKPHCYLHMCNEEGCLNPTEVFISYCDRHNCIYPGCNGDRYRTENSDYCLMHYIDLQYVE